MTESPTRTRRVIAAVVVSLALVLALLTPGWRHSTDDRSLGADTSAGEEQAGPDCTVQADDTSDGGAIDTAAVCDDAQVGTLVHALFPDSVALARDVHPDDLLARSTSLGLPGNAFDLADPDTFSPLAFVGLAEAQPELFAMRLPGGSDPFAGSGGGQGLWGYGPGPAGDGVVLVGRPGQSGSGGSSGGGGGGGVASGGGSFGGGSFGGDSFTPDGPTGGETGGNETGGNETDGGDGGDPGAWTPPGGLPNGGPTALVSTTPPVATVPGPSALPLAGIGIAIAALLARRRTSRM
jgi:hypothetical protein